VYLPDGREGYIPGNYVQAPPIPWREQKEENFREGVVQSALLYLGTQYRWGGKTSVGIDCSGLASVAYMLNGALIYRDAKIMPGFDIHEIPRENLKKGDLLFYKGHVTLYVGDKRFIHSTAHYGTEGVCLCGMEPGMDGYREDLEKIYLASGSLF
jgi:cell wall-associated NlpC family hydrolase